MSGQARARKARDNNLLRSLSFPQTRNAQLDTESRLRLGWPTWRALSPQELTDNNSWQPRRTSSPHDDDFVVIENEVRAPLREEGTSSQLNQLPAPMYIAITDEQAGFDQFAPLHRTSPPLLKDGGALSKPNPVPEPPTDDHLEQVGHFSKQLRRLRKMTDNVLLKRTQMRHQQQKLEDCREYLHKSTVALRSDMQIHQSALELNAVKPKSESQERRKDKDGSEEGGDQLKEAGSGEPSASSSARVDSGMASGDGGEQVYRMVNASQDAEVALPSNPLTQFEQYDQDYRALLLQEDVVKGLMDELSNLEFHLESKEKAVSDTMRLPYFIDSLQAEWLEQSLATSELSSRPKSGTNTPPLVVDYFDKAGDVGIQRERLEELDFTHREGLQARDFLKERGDELSVPDDEFDAKYFVRREEIKTELRVAQAEADRLARQCASEGLDIKAHRNAAPSAFSSSPQGSDAGEDGLLSTIPRVHALGLPPSVGPADPTTSTRRIKGWLRDVPGPAGESDADFLTAPLLDSSSSSVSAPAATLEEVNDPSGQMQIDDADQSQVEFIQLA